MSGYNWPSGMSNNAVAAYNNGLCPASKISGIPASLVEKFCAPEEWHHASKFFNKVNFYNPDAVREVFATEPEAIAALTKWRLDRNQGSEIHTDCVVEWLDWSGSLKRPTCTERKESGCLVSVKGKTATITLASGKTVTKRIGTRGFRFDSR